MIVIDSGPGEEGKPDILSETMTYVGSHHLNVIDDSENRQVTRSCSARCNVNLS